MSIDRSNYESYFIDYIDGNLSVEIVDEFLNFLNSNPDLAEELKAVGDNRLKPEPAIFPDKDQLYKQEPDSDESFDLQAIAFLEGDLNEENEQEFLSRVTEDAVKLTTLQLLRKIRLQPDLTEQCPAKEQLLRKKRIPIYLWAARIAAIVVFFISIWALLPRKEANFPGNQIAEKTGNQLEGTKTPELEPSFISSDNTLKNQIAENLPDEKEQTSKKISPLPLDNQHQKPKAASKEMEAKREEHPSQLVPLKAHLDIRDVTVSVIQIPRQVMPVAKTPLTVDEFLAYKLIDAPKGESFTFNNLANAGLKVAQNISNNRIAFECNDKGKIEEITFESRLIAFSIPIKKNR